MKAGPYESVASIWLPARSVGQPVDRRLRPTLLAVERFGPELLPSHWGPEHGLLRAAPRRHCRGWRYCPADLGRNDIPRLGCRTGNASHRRHRDGARYHSADRREICRDAARDDAQGAAELGTGGGIAAVSEAAIDLALSARPLTDAEHARGLLSFAYSRTPIAFVTHPALAVGDTTLSDVARILTGSLLAWPDGTRIRLVRREPSDADWTMLRTLSPDMSAAVSVALGRPGLLTVATDQENADTLERLPGSFGAMSIGQVRAENRHVAPLRLDGHSPEVTELAAGHYPLSRTLYVIWRQRPRPEIEQFLAFLRSEQSGQILIQLGHIPLLG